MFFIVTADCPLHQIHPVHTKFLYSPFQRLLQQKFTTWLLVNSNKSPTRCNSFSVYYPDVYLQLNMFRAFSRPSSGAQWLQWQPPVLQSNKNNRRFLWRCIYGPNLGNSINPL